MTNKHSGDIGESNEKTASNANVSPSAASPTDAQYAAYLKSPSANIQKQAIAGNVGVRAADVGGEGTIASGKNKQGLAALNKNPMYNAQAATNVQRDAKKPLEGDTTPPAAAPPAAAPVVNVAPAAVPQGAASLPEIVAPTTPAAATTALETYSQAAEGANANKQAYDAATAAAMAGGPAAAMERQNAAAREEARRQSDVAIRQSIKGAKTAGMMGGQAALAATGQAANAYGAGMAQGQEQYNKMLGMGAQLGESMAGRLFNAGQGQANIAGNQMSADTSKYATQMGAQTSRYGTAVGAQVAREGNAITAKENAANRRADTIGNVIGAVGGIASLFSDRRLKDNVRPARIYDSLEKIKGYTYKYKGGNRPEAGVMAQDLEKTAMAPAVVDTPEGKMVDTRRLSTMNTAAIAEQSQRMKEIEKMLKGMKEMQ